MKFLLLFSFVVMTIVTHAQFAHGDKFFGGSFSVGLQKGSGSQNFQTTYNSFSLQPSIGYFLNDKYAVGGGLGYSTTYQKTTYDLSSLQRASGHSINIHAFLKRYFIISDKFFFAMTGGISYGRGIETQGSGTGESKTKNYSVGMNAYPSLIFFPSTNWAIEGSIGGLYLAHTRNLSADSKYTSFNFDYGTFSLGFAYYLRKPAE